MRQARILMIEDEFDIAECNRQFLEGQGYEISVATTLSEARNLLEESIPDLILLDVLMPDGLGWDFCKELKKDACIPVIFLSSMDENGDIIRGLNLGGDDYIVKPYDLEILGARVAAQLRKTGVELAGKIKLPHLLIDILSGTVTIEDRQVSLPPKEMQLLCCLALASGRRISGEELYRRTWGWSQGAWDHIVSVNISRLRKHLGLDDASIFELIYTKDKAYIFRRVRFDGES